MTTVMRYQLVVSDWTFTGISGTGAFNGHMLMFRFQTREEHGIDAWADQIYGKVYLGSDFVGSALPSAPLLLSTRHPRNSNVALEMRLTTADVEAIERKRAGGNLTFNLKICAMTYGGEQADQPPTASTRDITCYVNQAAWLEALSGMGFGSHVLYALPIDLAGQRRLSDAIEQLERAKRHLYQGNYDDVVATCRKALEVTFDEIDPDRSIRNHAGKELGRRDSKEERMIRTAQAVYEYTHLPHHPAPSYSRSEALFALGAAAATISALADLDTASTK